MRWRRFVRIGGLCALGAGACSAGTSGEVAHPRPEITPIPTVKVDAGPPRPPACEVAGRLIVKAEALRSEGLLARAARALDDAQARCPEKAKDVATARATVESLRAAGAGESAQSLGEALFKMGSGDVPARRRAKEKWLSALDRESGQTMRFSMPDPTVPVDFAWSPDGSRGAAVSGGGLSIWDADLRVEQGRYEVPRAMLRVFWLPSERAASGAPPKEAAGRVLVADLQEGKYRVVDLEKKRTQDVFDVPLQGAEGLTLSPDGKVFAIREGSTVMIVDLAQKKPIGTLNYPSPVNDVAISPAGDKVAVGLSDGATVVHALMGPTPLYTLPAISVGAEPRFQSDKRLLVLSEGHVTPFDAVTGKPAGKELVNNDCSPLALGPAADRILWKCYAYLEVESAKGSKRKTLYAPSTQAHLYTSFEAFSVSPDGSLVWYSLWGTQYMVSTITGSLLSGVSAPTWFGMRIRPGSKRLAAVGANGVSLWTSDMNKDERYVIGDNDPGGGCSWAGVSAAGGLQFGDVRGTDEGFPAMTTASLRDPAGAGKEMSAVRIEDCPESSSADASRFGVQVGDAFHVIDLVEGKSVAQVPLPRDERARAEVTSNGSAVVTWGSAGVKVWSVATGKTTSSWTVPVGPKAKVTVSPSGERVLVVEPPEKGVARKSTLYTTGLPAGVELSLGEGPFAFAGDDRLLEAGPLTVVVHDLATHEDRSIPGVAGPLRLTVTPDGATAIVATKDATHLIDVAGGTGPRGTLLTGSGALPAVFFAGGRAAGVYSEQQGTVQLYQLPSGARLGELRRTGSKGAVYFSETGNLEPLGEGAKALECLRDPGLLPASDCEERFVEAGLWARTLAGRGCTAEDVGDVCD